MITTNLTGNIGNHMWYYSICRIVAEKLGYEWGINPNPTHDYFGGKNQMDFMDVDFGKKVTKIGVNDKGLNIYEGIPNEYYDKHKFHSYNGDNCLINMYDPGVFDIKDNTMIHMISQSEDYFEGRRNDMLDWFKINIIHENYYKTVLNQFSISLDEDTCVINFRGGEYRGVQNLICNKEYWKNSIDYMKALNKNMKFVIITDDKECAREFIGDYTCIHVEVGFDFYVVNKAKYLILSNSSFGWWAGWLNTNANLIIAPKYWAKHNISNGYWSLGDSYSRFFHYMNREGVLETYEQCKEEALKFYKENNLL